MSLTSFMPLSMQGGDTDQLAASDPKLGSLIAQGGGQIGNLNQLAAAMPNLGSMLSQVGALGGFNGGQATAMGPLFQALYQATQAQQQNNPKAIK